MARDRTGSWAKILSPQPIEQPHAGNLRSTSSSRHKQFFALCEIHGAGDYSDGQFRLIAKFLENDMSHPSQLEFIGLVKELFPVNFIDRKVLEIGSLDVNGSVRGFFLGCDYIGLDVAPGPGVDVVCEGQKFDAPNETFETVICCEVMEHNPYWKETFDNMMRVLKPGGLMIMSCATGYRPEHGTSRTTPGDSPLTVAQGWEYYRNLNARDIEQKVDFSQLASKGFATNWDSWDLYFIGLKRGGATDGSEQIRKFRAIYRNRVLPSLSTRLMRVLRQPARITSFMQRKTGLK
jgi:SAM-dependent methyltransferase